MASLPAAGGAEQPLNELFQSEAVYPQEAGEIQLTLRPHFERGGEGDETFQQVLGLEYGITDAWQLELGFASFVDHDPGVEASTRGIGDLELGTKYSFMNIRESNVHAALAFEITVPTGDPDRELGEGFMEYEPSLIVAKDFPDWHGLQLFGQVGLGFVDRVREASSQPADEDGGEDGEDGEGMEPAAHEFSLSAGAFVPVGGFTFVGEFNWVTNEWNHGGEENELYFTPGIVRRLPGSWEISVGVPIGLNRGADDYRIIGTLIYEFDL